MLLDSILPVGIVAITVAMLVTLVYAVLRTPKSEFGEKQQALWNHQPILDDDMAYLAASLYPCQEYVHFPVVSPLDQQHVTQSA